MNKNLLSLFMLLLAMPPLTAREPAGFISSDTIQKVKSELLQKYGEGEKFRVERALKTAR